MKNLNVSITNNKLTIIVDLSKSFGESKSGKSTVVATSSGNVLLADGKTKLGINVFRDKE